jgi:hypothetical protein
MGNSLAAVIQRLGLPVDAMNVVIKGPRPETIEFCQIL